MSSSEHSCTCARAVPAKPVAAPMTAAPATAMPMATAAPTATAAPAKSGAGFGTFTSEDLDGNAVDQTVFAQHKLTMVNIWATYCGPCINEIPELAKLSADYADKDFQVVGLVIDVTNGDGSYSQDGIDTAKQILSQAGADYLCMLPSPDLTATALLRGVYAVPTTVFVDSEGNQVGEVYLGSNDYSGWAAVIDSLLGSAA